MDLDYLVFLQGIRENYGGEGFFLLISSLPRSALTAAIPAILFWCLNKPAGTFLLLNATFGRMINDFLKGIFCVYRPWIKNAEIMPSADAIKNMSAYSFPSGHTQFTTAIYGGFAFFYRKILPWLVIPCGIIVLMVAFSRNFLGMHTPQDVLVAIIYSIGLFFVAERIFKWMGRDEERKLIFFGCGVAITLIIFAILYLKPYPEDFLNGKVIIDPILARADAFDALGFGLSFFLGWYLEQKLIKFKTNVSAKRRFWRIVIGFGILGVIAVIFYPLMKILFSVEIYKFFRAFLPFFSILFVIPLIFTKLEAKLKY